MSKMRILGPRGDSELAWDLEDLEKIEEAEKTFKGLQKKGYSGFSVRPKGEAGKRLNLFNPLEEEIIMVPRLVGG